MGKSKLPEWFITDLSYYLCIFSLCGLFMIMDIIRSDDYSLLYYGIFFGISLTFIYLLVKWIIK
jgi:hypothetical protein